MKRIKLISLTMLIVMLCGFFVAGCGAGAYYVNGSFIVEESGMCTASFKIKFNRPGRYDIKYVFYSVDDKGKETDYINRQHSVTIDNNNLGEYTVSDSNVPIFAKPEQIRIKDLVIIREKEEVDSIITAVVIGLLATGMLTWLAVAFIKAKMKENKI